LVQRTPVSFRLALEMTRYRILLVESNDDGTAGGSYQCLHDLALNLDPARFEPVALFYQDNAFVGRLREADVSVHVWESSSTASRPLLARLGSKLAAVFRRRRFIREEAIDLVHLNNSPAFGSDDWLPAARLAGVPCITHARGEMGEADAWHRRHLRTKFDRVIAISRFVASAMTRVGIPAARITQIYDGIDLERFHARVRRPAHEVRSDLGVPDDVLLIAMIGHIRWWKGQDVVLEAIAGLDEATRRRLFVLFVGPTSPTEQAYHDRLTRLVAEKGLEDRVAFLGQRDDVPDIMSAADVVLCPSTAPEPFGLVVIEAMAAGKPVVATRHGGPAEVVTPASGLFFDPGSSEQLGALLATLLDDPELRAALGKAGLERVEAFSVDRTVAAIERVYDELLGAPRTSTARAGASTTR
jgi:glycosyltransferase involved in cell wall biosynthesis